jgi:ABC-type dipeptide/oligopeptide/nickel transport system ATPase component
MQGSAIVLLECGMATSFVAVFADNIRPKAPGCRFAPRCHLARAQCTAQTPPLREIRRVRRVACVLY